MSGRGPTFTRLEADQILRRAAALEGTSAGRRLTTEDVWAIAIEAGFSADAVEQALAEAGDPGPAPARPAVEKWGFLVMHRAAVRHIPVPLTSDARMRAIRLFHPYREGSARLTVGPDQITWRDRRGLHFTVSWGTGYTEVSVYVSKVALRRRRWTEWVRTAADRLEELLLLMARRDAAAGPATAPPLPPSETEG